jgi:hypothetical protein
MRTSMTIHIIITNNSISNSHNRILEIKRTMEMKQTREQREQQLPGPIKLNNNNNNKAPSAQQEEEEQQENHDSDQ